MSLKDVIAPFYIWKRAFEKPYTTARPIEDRKGSDNYRGFHTNDMEKCIGCGTCEIICQNEAIDMVPVAGIETTPGDSGLRPMVDNGRCCWCALCVDICTTGSLRLTNEYIWASTDGDAFRFIPGTGDNPWDDKESGYRRDPDYRLLDYERQAMEMLTPEQGVQSFIEVVKGYSAEQARKEAARCVDCGLCIATCPAHMDIPEYIKAVRDGDFEADLQLLYRTNPMPATCGRICTHRCEDVCSVGHMGDPVAIRWLKRYICDQVPEADYAGTLRDDVLPIGRNVAIIGAGPGGLSAAYYLVKLGYAVTLYEAHEKAGGMLRYGVPSYRMPYDQLDKDVDYVISPGVSIRYNARVVRDVEFTELMDGFDAIFFSTGLTEPYGLGVEGEKHPRVLSGLQVLEDVTHDRDPGVGKRVAVIGGGNVAMDAARVSRRLGAEVTVLYRRRIEDMPADPEEIHEAQAEQVHFVTRAIPVRVDDGPSPDQVNIQWGEAEMVADGKGCRPRPVLMEDRVHTETYDSIISAIGQGGDFSFLSEEYAEQVEMKRGKVIANEQRQTGIPKLFVGGDIANRTADAISAIADGHQAAIGIDRFLSSLIRNRASESKVMAEKRGSDPENAKTNEETAESLEDVKARAIQDVKAEVANKDDSELVRSQAGTKKGKGKKTKPKKHMEAICKLPFVEDLNDGECGRLAGISSVVTLKKGQILIEQGKKDDSLYVVIQGRIQVNRNTGGGDYVTLACIREGEMAGEMGFLDGSEHSATLRADDTTDVLQIKRKHLESLLDKDPQIVYKLMRAIAREVHEITKRMNLQFVEMSNYIRHEHGRY